MFLIFNLNHFNIKLDSLFINKIYYHFLISFVILGDIVLYVGIFGLLELRIIEFALIMLMYLLLSLYHLLLGILEIFIILIKLELGSFRVIIKILVINCMFIRNMTLRYFIFLLF
jgi:hypothetical protein